MIQDGFHLLNGKLPWGQLPPFDLPSPHSPILYQSFRGWDQNRWYDGPSFIRVDGIVQAYKLPGLPGSLSPSLAVTNNEALTTWLLEREIFAWKKSLALAFRDLFNLNAGAYLLQGLQAAAVPALVLLGLRIAFPETRFFVFDLPAAMKPQWKRYCQNLNLETWASPAQRQSLSPLNLQPMYELWDPASATHFFTQFNRKVPVLPQSLCNMFESFVF